MGYGKTSCWELCVQYGSANDFPNEATYLAHVSSMSCRPDPATGMQRNLFPVPPQAKLDFQAKEEEEAAKSRRTRRQFGMLRLYNEWTSLREFQLVKRI